jgi:hypothetical protein
MLSMGEDQLSRPGTKGRQLRAIASIRSPSVALRRSEMGRQDVNGAASDDRREPCRSLMVVDVNEEAHPLGRCAHPTAPFLAHLIATQQQVPQTRQRRRAEPEDAVAVYAAAAHIAADGKDRALI